MMNCSISPNPSIPAENARCQAEQNAWTAAAWALAIRLLKGPVRCVRGTARSERSGLVDDLRRRGLVQLRGGGWIRITERGREMFPRNRCTRWREWPGVGIWLDLDAQRARVCKGGDQHDAAVPGRLAACDSRPACWRSASAALCRPCAFAPRAARARVPVQIIRGWTTNVAEFDDPKRETYMAIPSLADVLRHAPAWDESEVAPSTDWWPGLGQTDVHPATRQGYSTGPRIEREYA